MKKNLVLKVKPLQLKLKMKIYKSFLTIFLAIMLIGITTHRINVQRVNTRAGTTTVTFGVQETPPQDLYDGTEGEILFNFSIGSKQTIGYAYGAACNGTHLFVLCYGEPNIQVYNIEDDSYIHTFTPDIGGEFTPAADLAWDGQYLWFTEEGKLYQITTTGAHVRTVTPPYSIGRSAGGLAFDGTDMWVATHETFTPIIYKVNLTDGSDLASYDTQLGSLNGLAYSGKFLWIASSAYRIYRFNVETGTLVSSFSVPYLPWGLAFDGTHLWAILEDNSVFPEEYYVCRIYVDLTGPSTSLVSHHEGETVTGIPQVELEIEDPAEVVKVELLIENIHPSWMDITSNYDADRARYYFTWNTTEAADGEYAILIRTTDTLQNVATTTYRLIVDNTGPVLSFVSPKEGESVQGMVRLAVRAEDASPIALVEIRIEAALEGWVNITANYDSTEDSYYYEWNTTQTANGPYTITIRATDSIGNEGTGTLHLNVDNPIITEFASLEILFALSFFVVILRRKRKR